MKLIGARSSRCGVAGAFFVALLLVAPAIPAAGDDDGQRPLSEEQQARLEARMAEIRSRLGLSEEQQAQLAPIVRKSFERRAAVMRQHGLTGEPGQRLGRSETRALMRDLKAVRVETEAEVDQILDDRQMEEFRKIREEARDGARERLRKAGEERGEANG